jgi:Protein SET DOMAIN GROUP 2 C-terminal/CW-type Zinc Finger/SET domain
MNHMSSPVPSLAFPERRYERLRVDKVCAGLSELDERIAAYELKTSLQDKFIGLAYKYDDTGQSEGWMKSILDVAGNKSEHQQAAAALASDDGAIKAQVNASMQSLLIGVLDKVMTDSGVLQQRELRCANEMDGASPNALEPEFVVQEVWGIDCYTRRNVAICLETEFDSDSAQTFTEKWLLPAINACPVDLAHDISNACLVLEGLPFDLSASLNNDDPTTYDQWRESLLGKALLSKVVTFAPPWLSAAARLVRVARDNLGPDFFRIHPKGHGSIVLCGRLEPNRLVTFYRGEVYPSWRWGEKTDAIAKIQEQKRLKPVLPDFFNMALERPQHDPRGYGLLFVDASRKSNYGSMLSHSCQPSCEVHVVAVNGELRLAITTIREMTIGDELTFDYNAVTESLMEYQSAVCLCGHKRCSGSFLHFAAADCYQQVLNRNSPVASRLANLIKGCTKKVMADDDERILGRHGFQTAAFGAVSVNRRKAHALDELDTSLDSMNIVPVWLRTYVADTLRYIEYERRALPIALICNDLYDETGNVPVQESEDSVEESTSSEGEEESESDEVIEQSKRLSKPEPPFFFYSRMQRSYFESLLGDDDKNSLSGTEMRREVQKLAAATWESLDEEAHESWKAKALEDWEKSNTSKLKVESASKQEKKLPKKKKVKVPRSQRKSESTPDGPKRPKISFQQADAEGVSAMEQRIQQLTQTLSRIGRVLDRHRESRLQSMDRSESSFSDEALREVIHSPLQIMPDEHVVAWMWNHEEGIIRSLLKYVDEEVCVSPELRLAVRDTVAKHDILEKFGRPWHERGAEICFPMNPLEGRERLNEAMLELRKNLLDGIQQMASVIKKHRAKERLTARKREREAGTSSQKTTNDDSVDDTICSVMDEILRSVEERFSVSSVDDTLPTVGAARGKKTDPDDPDASLDPWLRNYNKRFKIEKAADLLLLYVKTGHFFVIKTYEVLRSSPIEVYARELGNAVPASTIDMELRKEPESARSSVVNSPIQSPGHDGDEDLKDDVMEGSCGISDKKSRQFCKLCQPEDIISNVVVEYQGDYVLSQLLQWYNAGIGQKPGLPDVLGCVLLPSMKGCWTVDGTTGSNSFTDRATRYQSTTRRRLLAWLKDPLQRGNPWPDDLRKAFLAKDDNGMINDATGRWLPLGSPILDFLVTGDDQNINSTLAVLSGFHASAERSGHALGDELLSTVDEGRPAEAVSNWALCENPKCQKWRKIPWHVDVNMLPEQFYCKDNIWNPNSASCDAPEDVWDQATDAQVGLEDTGTLLDAIAKAKSGTRSCFKLTDFRLGGK